MSACLERTTVLQWSRHVRAFHRSDCGGVSKHARVGNARGRERVRTYFQRYASNDGRSCAMIHVINLQVSFPPPQHFLRLAMYIILYIIRTNVYRIM
jgi:hypothetical protein